jgi:hypothetical protein
MNSLLDLWNSCLLLSNFQYWSTLLAANVWVIWLERNKRVFNTSLPSEYANLSFLIVHLFRLWIDTSANFESILVGDVGLVLP